MSKVGDVLTAKTANWNFSHNDISNLLKHIERSIPEYKLGHQLILQLSDFFVQKNCQVYDLGCSSGKLIEDVCNRHSEKKASFIGIDVEPKMINYALARAEDKKKELAFYKANIVDYSFKPCNLFIAYYTIQFLNSMERKRIIKEVYKKLNMGGAFVLFEKVRASSSITQEIMTELYQDYKFNEGYTGDEILAKGRSLRGVLNILTTEQNIFNLKKAGFSSVTSIYKHLCFEGFLAIK